MQLDLVRFNVVEKEHFMRMYTVRILVSWSRSTKNLVRGKYRCSLLACLHNRVYEVCCSSSQNGHRDFVPWIRKSSEVLVIISSIETFLVTCSF